jgi:hypothetical protein
MAEASEAGVLKHALEPARSSWRSGGEARGGARTHRSPAEYRKGW